MSPVSSILVSRRREDSLNETLQFNGEGDSIPPEEYSVIMLPGCLKKVPIPATIADQPPACEALFRLLRNELPPSTYLASIMMGGE